MPSEFRNEALIDFSKPENEKAMQDALDKVAALLGVEYDLVISGKPTKGGFCNAQWLILRLLEHFH